MPVQSIVMSGTHLSRNEVRDSKSGERERGEEQEDEQEVLRSFTHLSLLAASVMAQVFCDCGSDAALHACQCQ